jgi:DNA polymerase III alpha subunit (gram-positive type)
LRALFSSLLLLALAVPLAAQEEMAWPEEDPEGWLLCFVDVETTGLVPGHHEMIDAGMVWTDLEGEELGRLFLRIMPRHPERASPGAVAVNAFSVRRWQELGALDPEEAVARMVTVHDSLRAGRRVMMVAFNSHFDTAFMDHLFRSVDASWRDLFHYFVLDIPSMAWSLGLRQLTGAGLSEALGVRDEPHVAEEHTGITGALLNARLYRAIRERGSAPKE